jgi:glycosyltransferase involved in cell wall biosynthesis
MLNVLHIISSLDAGAAANQLGLLAPVLPRDKFRVEVCALSPAGATADDLRRALIPVHAVRVRHALDVSALGKVRAVASELRPAIVHAWDAPSLLASRVVPGAKLVASHCANLGGGVTKWFAARRLRAADRVLPTSRAEAERYDRIVHSEALTRIPLAVAPPAGDRAAFRTAIGVPPDARLIFAGGTLDTASGVKDAIWAFDMLRYEFADLHLVVFGDGPDRQRLRDLARSLGRGDDRVRFPGHVRGLASLLVQAAVVWLTAGVGGGLLALEAMAAARPVVAFPSPEVTELVCDGETAFVAPHGDRVRLGAVTRTLLDDPALAARLGDAGRARAVERHGVGRAAEQLARVYGEVAGV